MIRIGTVWERTTEVIAGRASLLAWLAGLFLFAPGVLQAIMRLLAIGNPSSSMKLLAAIVGLAVVVFALWGTLAMIAMASDPSVDRREAIAQARGRLPAALGVMLVILVVTLVVVVLPLSFMVAGSIDMARLEQGAPALDAATAAKAGWLLIVMSIVALLVGARLLPLFAVVLLERRGLGAFARSFALTRGSTIRLIGLMLLYAVVALVLIWATTFVLGVTGRILFGQTGQAWTVLLVSIATGILTAGLSVLQSVFSAQFYLAARAHFDRRDDA